MSLTSRRIAPLLIFAGTVASIALPAIAAADPVSPTGGGSPPDTISDLEGQGYNVQINYINGNSDTPLALCSVTAVHNPAGSTRAQETFTTVYVDVDCPDYWSE